MLREVPVTGPIHLIPGNDLQEKLRQRESKSPLLPAGPEQIIKDLSRRSDGLVPATVVTGKGKGRLYLYTYGYVVHLGLNKDERFFWINDATPFTLWHHAKLDRSCLLLRSKWRVKARIKELPENPTRCWRKLCKEWQQLEQDLADQENVARLDPQHERYLDMLDIFNEIAREVEAQDVSLQTGFAYQRVRPGGSRGFTTTSTYIFDIEGPVPKRYDYVQISGASDLRGQVVEVTGKAVAVKFDSSPDWNQLTGPGILVPAPFDVVHVKRRETAEALRSRQTQNRSLLKVLVEHQTRPMRKVEVQPSQQLDPSQERALRSALSIEDLLIVLGPPGTGKTRVITEMVDALRRSDNGKTLVTSFSNKAVDNVLDRRPKDVIAIRLGDELKVDPNVQPILLDNYAHELREGLKRSSRVTCENYQKLPEALRWHQLLGEQLTAWEQSRSELASRKAELERCRRSVGGPAHARVQQISQQLDHQRERARRAQNSLNQAAQRADHTRDSWWSRLVGRLRDRRVEKQRHRFDAVSKRWNETRELLRLAHDQLEAMLQEIPEVRAAQLKCEDAAGEVDQNRADALKTLSTLSHALFNIESLPPVPGGADDATTFQFVGGLHQGVQRRIGLLHTRSVLANEWHDAVSSCPIQQIRPELIRYADVIGTTCVGAATQKDIAGEEFDLVIVDEAGQVQTSDALIPLIRGKRGVLVGDHKQLPPVTKDSFKRAIEKRDDATELLALSQKSMLEILVESVPTDHVVQLQTQRRMPEAIARLISEHFYGGTVKSAVEPRRGDALFSRPLVFVDTSTLLEHERRETQVEDAGYINRAEARILNRLAEHYNSNRAEWALIVPYNEQLGHLKEEASHWAPNSKTVEGNFGTVDAFQGGERDVVLYGFTRSNAGGYIGFLDELRRLNVAFTRAKQRLVLVGDLEALLTSRDPDFTALMEKLRDTLRRDGEIVAYNAIVARLTELGS
ncbi:AAA domain-containing protein [Saccharopolyspora indica]|uniref:DEAD/DEAH box helicase n=1 Tax=Saccharopolyspora indica TaxID=1229659 RepID=UPI0022EA7629|nr:AAA domain-containing protein [Saccharopolyspora indica]MDA3647937.1 AAA domain-containing protein [Saccharopolyspora indica]